MNRIYSNCIFVLLVFLKLFLPTAASAQAGDSTRLSLADIKTIHSNILGEDRKIYIYQSAGASLYQAQPLPVLYLTDGEVHTALVASQVQYLADVYGELPPMIVVGIGNYSYDRMRDLTPTHSVLGFDGQPDTSRNSPLRTTGGGDKFLEFIQKEVIPYVEANYKTTPYKILSGHSLGGLMSFYCLSTKPDLFNAYIAVSPSLWWDNGSELKRAAASIKKGSFANKPFFYSDGNEGGIFHERVLSLDSALNARTGVAKRHKYVYYPLESHGSEPVKAEYDGLKFIFANWKPAATDTSAALIKRFYEQLSVENGYHVTPPEALINTLGYGFYGTPGKINEAIELFEMNVRNYPTSFNTYDSLGDALASKGGKPAAIKNYKKAIELNPDSAETKRKLAALEK